MARSSFAPNPVKIKVIGLGGGGCNAITRMVRDDIQGVEFIAMNTDAQALAITEAPIRVQMGDKLVRGRALTWCLSRQVWAVEPVPEQPRLLLI